MPAPIRSRRFFLEESSREVFRVKLPSAYLAAPIDPDARGGLSVSVVFRNEQGSAQFIDVRSTSDARVVLGCLMDAAGTVHDWLEIWIQDVPGMRRVLGPDRPLPGAVLDERFRASLRAGVGARDAQIVRLGSEDEPASLLALDPASGRIVPVVAPGATAGWRLCRDDVALAGAGLAPYSTSVHRYATASEAGGGALFVPLSDGAPANDRTLDPQAAQAAGGTMLNPEAGAIGVRRFAPLGLDEYLDVLAGDDWSGLAHARHRLPAPNMAPDASEVTPAGRLACEGSVLAAQHGSSARLLEGFYLRLRAITDAFEGVRAAVEATGRPLLNLRADSFRVALGEPARALPLAWTARTLLVDPGDSIRVDVPGSEARLFTRVSGAGASVYWPDSASGSNTNGRGSVRVRRVLADNSTGVIVEGTLSTSERVGASATDLVWLRLPLGSGPVDLYVRAESEAALAQGEWRFRSVGQRLGAGAAESIRQSEGVPLRDVPFRVMPVMSTPCDLYALGVLGVRALLTGNGNTLAMAVDEVMSLARQLAGEFDDTLSLEDRIKAVMNADGRWATSLGPHRIAPAGTTPEGAFDAIPPEMWRTVLGLLVRAFPGLGPDSRCRDLGDAPSAGVHVVFDDFVAVLDSLLQRTRSLMFLDWKYNREIGGMIRRRLMGARPRA